MSKEELERILRVLQFCRVIVLGKAMQDEAMLEKQKQDPPLLRSISQAIQDVDTAIRDMVLEEVNDGFEEIE